MVETPRPGTPATLPPQPEPVCEREHRHFCPMDELGKHSCLPLHFFISPASQPPMTCSPVPSSPAARHCAGARSRGGEKLAVHAHAREPDEPPMHAGHVARVSTSPRPYPLFLVYLTCVDKACLLKCLVEQGTHRRALIPPRPFCRVHRTPCVRAYPRPAPCSFKSCSTPAPLLLLYSRHQTTLPRLNQTARAEEAR